MNAWRAIAVAEQLPTLRALAVSLDPLVRLVAAVIWAVLLLATAVGLWQRRLWSRMGIPILLGLYAFYQLGFLALFRRVPAAQAGLPVDIVYYLLLIALVIWTLNRPPVQSYFQRPARED